MPEKTAKHQNPLQGEIFAAADVHTVPCYLSIEDLISRLEEPSNCNNAAKASKKALSPSECDLLLRCEQTIKNGIRQSAHTALAFLVICRRRLYRARFRCFAEYVRNACAVKQAHVYRLIDYAEVCLELSPLRRQLPSEQQARIMLGLKLSQEDRCRVWKIATFRGRVVDPETFDSALIEVVGKDATRTIVGDRS